jgi:hypothetical protein
MTGIVYFIQPREYLGTNIYKIGCSRDAVGWTRLKHYGSGSRRICVMECIDPFGVESVIKEHFNARYKLATGREYFAGDEASMRRTFMNSYDMAMRRYSPRSTKPNPIVIDLTDESDDDQTIKKPKCVIDLTGDSDDDQTIKKPKCVIDLTGDQTSNPITHSLPTHQDIEIEKLVKSFNKLSIANY